MHRALPPAGFGLSIRWTARANMARRARIGLCILRWRLTVRRLWCRGAAGAGADLTSQAGHVVPPAGAKPRMLVSRTRPAAEAVAVARALDAELVPMGSAGAKAMAVLRGEADIYLHSGGI